MVRLIVILQLITAPNKKFQFHDGTIDSFLYPSKSICFVYFNSTMVRLIAEAKQDAIEAMNLFQFHDGTIDSSDE